MGVAKGTNRASEAAKQAITSPLLEDGSVEGAKGMLLNITGGLNLSLHEVDEASQIAKEAADSQANIIVGQVIDPNMEDEVIVTVIATGFEQPEPKAKPQPIISPAIQERTNMYVPPPPPTGLGCRSIGIHDRRGVGPGSANIHASNGIQSPYHQSRKFAR